MVQHYYLKLLQMLFVIGLNERNVDKNAVYEILMRTDMNLTMGWMCIENGLIVHALRPYYDYVDMIAYPLVFVMVALYFLYYV